jgi:hypothetical protein
MEYFLGAGSDVSGVKTTAVLKGLISNLIFIHF